MKIKPLAVAAAAMMIAFTATASLSPVKTTTVSAESGYSVWSEFSTEKIRRDKQYTKAESGNKSISVRMLRNERESAQLIVSARSDIKSYSITAGELKNENGTVFKPENVEFFNQCYIQTLRQSNRYYDAGWYPDALLPMETAARYGENKVSAGENQGIWIRFSTDEHTEAGVYTGNFTLTADGSTETIPVSVEVYDLTIPEYEWDSTSYLIYTEYLTYGERDSSYDMWKAYYEFFLDYGISLYGLPVKGRDIANYCENVKTYYDRMGSYAIPYLSNMTLMPSNQLKTGPDFEQVEDVIRALIEMSVKDGKDYLKKSYIYNLYIDEYTATHAFGQSRIETARVFAPYMKRVIKSAVEYFDSAMGAGYIDSVEGLRDSALNIRLVAVSSWLDGVSNLYNVFCPAFPGYQLKENRDRFAGYMSGEFDELWWYGGVGTNYPASPSYQIDDPLIDERVLGWQAYDYNIKGNLYWQVNLYSDATSGYFLPGDPWELANRSVGSVNGDGWLVYPGQKYGIYGPVGTVRLEAIRDGMEETKYLRLFNELYAEASEYYGDNYELRAAMQSVYDSLYSGVLANIDSANFDDKRAFVMDSMMLMRSPEKLLISKQTEDLNGYDVSVVMDKSASITRSENEYTVTNTPNGKGKVYSFRIAKGEGDKYLSFTYTAGGEEKKFEKLLGEGYYSKVAFDKDADKAVLRLSNESGNEKGEIVTRDGQKGLAVTLKSKSIAGIYGPYAYFLPSEVFADEIGSLKAIAVDIYNDGAEDVAIRIMQRTKNSNNVVYDLVLLTATLKAGEWTRVVVKDLSAISFAQDFKIIMPSDANKTYNLVVSNLAYNVEGGK